MLENLRYLYFLEILLFVIPYGITFYLTPLFILLPLKLCPPTKRLWWTVERTLYKTFAYLVPFYPNRRRYNLKAYGDFKKLQKILEDKNHQNDCGIVVVNHQTTVDISTLIQFWGGISKKLNAWGVVCWIQDYLLGVLPSGWVSKVHGDFFVLQSVDVNSLTKCTQCHRSSKKIRHKMEIRLREHSKNIFKRHRFMQFFPEGGFYLNRKESSRRFAEKNGLKVLDHVALPRTAGMSSIMNELDESGWLAKNSQNTSTAADEVFQNPSETQNLSQKDKKVRHCIFLTVAYPDQQRPWSVFDVMTGKILSPEKREHAYIHIKVMDICQVPLPIVDQPQYNREGEIINKKPIKEKMQEPFEQWLINEYGEMDKVLSEFYSNEEEDDLGEVYDLSLSGFWLWFHYFGSMLTGLGWIAGVVCLCIYA